MGYMREQAWATENYLSRESNWNKTGGFVSGQRCIIFASHHCAPGDGMSAYRYVRLVKRILAANNAPRSIPVFNDHKMTTHRVVMKVLTEATRLARWPALIRWAIPVRTLDLPRYPVADIHKDWP